MAEATGELPSLPTTMAQEARRKGGAVHVPFPSEAELQAMSNQCSRLIASVAPELAEASELARRVNGSITSELSTKTTMTTTADILNNITTAQAAADDATTPAAAASQVQAVVTQSSTGGFSNVNHVIACTGDYETDRICQLKRAMILRVSAQQPESKGEERWDKPRVFGQRRRRIVRERDAVEAPPEPPLSGYVIFLGQMTCKMRHERHVNHQPYYQPEVMSMASKMWKDELSDADRDYYKRFSGEARLEYKRKSIEFRATGTFEPSEMFERHRDGVGLWTRKKMHEKNALESEIAGYENVIFPRRPPEMDEAYNQRMKQSLELRKQKLRVPEEKRKRARHNAKKKSSNQKNRAPPAPEDAVAGNDDAEQNQQELSEALDAAQVAETMEEGNEEEEESLVKQASASSDDEEEMSESSSQDPNKD